ncbi:MAG: sulfatase [Armatimonadota bacterium]|nr:sulfatase [Armatimonadota bacterium]
MTDDVERPNILLVVLDSARADRFGCYGYEKRTTPNIDRIAEEGTLFTECYSESSWTLPVSFTLLTGLVPREHRSESYRELPPELPTLQEAMIRAGYETFLFSSNAFLGPATGLQRGFDHFDMSIHVRGFAKLLLKYVTLRLGLTDTGGQGMTGRLLRYLPRVTPPWFGVVWYNECHHPYMGKQPFSTKFATRPLSLARRFHLMSRMRRMQELAATGSQEDLEDISSLYDGALAYNDHLVGQLREAMEKLGLWEDTVVVICADHGDMLGDRGVISHGRPAGMYRPLIRVPLIVRAPHILPTGHRSHALVQLSDLTETFAAMAGQLEALPGTATQRINLREAATGSGRQHAVSERSAWPERSLRRARKRNPSFDFDRFAGHMAAYIEDGWELISSQTGRNELYHLAEDPGETTDLIDEEPERTRHMREALRQWQERVLPHPVTEGLTEREDPEVRRRLEGMGYF